MRKNSLLLGLVLIGMIGQAQRLRGATGGEVVPWHESKEFAAATLGVVGISFGTLFISNTVGMECGRCPAGYIKDFSGRSGCEIFRCRANWSALPESAECLEGFDCNSLGDFGVALVVGGALAFVWGIAALLIKRRGLPIAAPVLVPEGYAVSVPSSDSPSFATEDPADDSDREDAVSVPSNDPPSFTTEDPADDSDREDAVSVPSSDPPSFATEDPAGVSDREDTISVPSTDTPPVGATPPNYSLYDEARAIFRDLVGTVQPGDDDRPPPLYPDDQVAAPGQHSPQGPPPAGMAAQVPGLPVHDAAVFPVSDV